MLLTSLGMKTCFLHFLNLYHIKDMSFLSCDNISISICLTMFSDKANLCLVFFILVRLWTPVLMSSPLYQVTICILRFMNFKLPYLLSLKDYKIFYGNVIEHYCLSGESTLWEIKMLGLLLVCCGYYVEA